MSAIFNLIELKFLRTYPSQKPHLLFNSDGLEIWHDYPVIKYNKVKSCRRSAIYNLINLTFFMVYPSLKQYILFDSNGLAIWQGFPVITYIEVKSGRRSAILKLIKLNFFMVYPYLKPHILLNCNSLAIWSGFSDNIVKKWPIIGHFGRHDLVSVRILFNFELIRANSEVDIWYKLGSDK